MAHIIAMGSNSTRGNVDADAHKLVVALHEVFNHVDEDGSGSLVKEEIGKLFSTNGIPLGPQELDDVMAEVDDDGGGDVDFEEFAAWMMGPSLHAENLRHNLHSNVLGGGFDSMINDEEVQRAAREDGGDERWVWKSNDGNSRETLFVFLEEPGTGRAAFWWSMAMQLLIFISSVIFVVETVEEVRKDETITARMHVIEWVCVIIFTVEYLVRLSVCTARPNKDQGFMTYFFMGMNLVDFFAVAPAYIELFLLDDGGGGFAVLRILRLARIFRVVKVGSFKENLDLVIEALYRSKSGLLLMVYLVVIFMVIMSSIMYMSELDGSGKPQGAFTDIPNTFWCTIVTMTSVGYGDMYPVTDQSRAIGSVIMLSGILTLAVPITLISNNFQDVWVAAKQDKKRKQMMEQMRHFKKDESNNAADEEEEEEELEAAPDVSELMNQTYLLTAIAMLDKSFDLTKDQRFNDAITALRADAAPTAVDQGSPNSVEET